MVGRVVGYFRFFSRSICEDFVVGQGVGLYFCGCFSSRSFFLCQSGCREQRLWLGYEGRGIYRFIFWLFWESRFRYFVLGRQSERMEMGQGRLLMVLGRGYGLEQYMWQVLIRLLGIQRWGGDYFFRVVYIVQLVCRVVIQVLNGTFFY